MICCLNAILGEIQLLQMHLVEHLTIAVEQNPGKDFMYV